MMKALLSLFFALALCLPSNFANITFNHARLTCNNSTEHSPGYTGCLRGQACVNKTCVFYPHPTVSPSHGEQSHGKRAPFAAQAGGEHAIGGEPTAGGEPTVGGGPTAGPVTVDGSCGASSNNTVCGDWSLGSCCSMYGYCGNDTAHCGSGCQSGPCLSGNPILGPGPSPAPPNPNPGSFAIVGRSGVPAQHAGLLPNNRVVFLDRLEINTELRLANSRFAYSAEYDPDTNTVVPLAYQSNAFCSGGTFLANGDFVSIGGNDGIPSLDPTIASGLRAVRYLSRSNTSPVLNGRPWRENNTGLSTARWYASAQILPDGNIFVASGSLNGLDPTVFANNNPTFEILNPNGVSVTPSSPLQILVDNQPYYMYPYIHLLNDGNLFIFTARASQVFSVVTNTVITTLPEMPGDFRTYPNGGGSVLLPLSSANGWAPEVMICGGGVVQAINSPTDPSCGRILPLSPAPAWSMDAMPTGRAMPEGVLLPDGTVLWLNGAQYGAEGFGLAADPQYTVLIYDPAAPLGARWTTGASSTIARLYHSVALLMLDGTVMVAGSNPVSPIITVPVAGQVPSEDYVTEFRVEVYTPPYLSGANAAKRPADVELSSTFLAIATQFTLTFTTLPTALTLRIALYHGGFVTHGLHMNQRILFLDHSGFSTGKTSHQVIVTMPPSHTVAPPGPYVVYVVVDGVPGVGQFVMVQ